MAVINIRTLIDILGGLGVTDAKIVATAYSGGKPAVRNVDDEVVFPKRIELAVVDGDPVADFELDQLPVGMYWSVGVYVNGLTNFRRTVRLPSGAGPFNFDELVDIDPTTALPDPDTEAADVYLAEVQDAADRAEAAATEVENLIETATSFTVVGGSSGTAPTFNGAPLFTGQYARSGDLVHFEIQVDFDNITSFGTGQYYVDLPFPSRHAYQFASGCLHDISTSRDYPIFGHVLAGESRMYLKSIDASGNSAFNVSFAQGSPITLSTADNFHISGDYIKDE